MTFDILFVGQVDNLQRVVNPLRAADETPKRRLTTGVQDTILPHIRSESRDAVSLFGHARVCCADSGARRRGGA
jgi:hypothetical protein